MSYVDGFFDRNADQIKIVERSKSGERIFRNIPVKYTFYYKDTKGKYESIYGDKLNRIVCKSTNDFRKEQAINSGKVLFESDTNPVFVALAEHYMHQESPNLNVAFWDIEVDMQPFAVPSQQIVKIRKKLK